MKNSLNRFSREQWWECHRSSVLQFSSLCIQTEVMRGQQIKLNHPALKTHPCNENRFFLVWENFTGKPLFLPCNNPVRDCSVFLIQIFVLFITANPFPVMTTGISLCSNSHREIPVMNTGSLQWDQGFPVIKTGFFLWEFTTQGKARSDPVLALNGIAVNEKN